MAVDNSNSDLMTAYPGSSLPIPKLSSKEESSLRSATLVVVRSRLLHPDPLRIEILPDMLDDAIELPTLDLDWYRSKCDSPSTWLSCEWAALEWGRAKKRVGCVGAGDVKQMQACGRVSRPSPHLR